MIPYARYPGLSPLFLDFLAGLPAFYPDPPTLEAAETRARELLASGQPARVPASAFRYRGAEGEKAAQQLASGRAIAVAAGHQVGLFTGPLFTLIKALDAVHWAKALSQRGVPAVAVFWALTDDHDLQEIARTAKPGPDGPVILVLEGADRQNRQPVGGLPIPDGVRAIVDAFRPDAKTDEALETLEAFARRSSPGTTYGDAFRETLLDLVAPDPLLVLDPLDEALRPATVAFFDEAVARAPQLRQTLEETAEALRRAGKPLPAPLPEGFSFFTIDADGRRRITDVEAASGRIHSGNAWLSADVITRPALKSYLLPMAVSVLGAGEIAYHAQSLPLFPLFELPRPVLIPRTHVVARGPGERRLAQQLEIPEQDLLQTFAQTPAAVPVPQADALDRLAQATERELSTLRGDLQALDPSLTGALENASKKITYQFEQLAERSRKAAERKGDVAANRRKRLERALLPVVGGTPAERIYPPLSAMLAFGREDVLAGLRRAAGSGAEGAAVVDFGLEKAAGAAGPTSTEERHAG